MWKVLVSLHPLSNIEITKYFNYKPSFNCVFSRNNLPRMKNKSVCDKSRWQKSKETHWDSLFIDRNTVYHIDSFGIRYISEVVLKKIRDISITRNIFIIKDDSIL